ncbi:hypothetical protein [Desulfosoma caldarium]|uniref:Uncharacterized protein n=1 Tax=Desulfosoma caldarium TaxID=610254 RepID=A0A3N1ULU6_9BACT|nr:hypothetical protein [Desulfosoma caldarium]ROQ91063.1 hypothetical protein EDC27_2340 [Desulfosoma caldarium]
MGSSLYQSSQRRAENKKFLWILLIVLLVLTGAALYVLVNMGRLSLKGPAPSAQRSVESPQGAGSTGVELVRKPMPMAEAVPPASKPVEAAPSTYPDVSPKTSQQKRKEAFGLNTSVDHVVQAQEPFSAHGRQWTVEEIQRRLAGQALPSPQSSGAPTEPGAEKIALGGYVPKPMPAASAETPVQKTTYYGVRLVRPGENVWKIHYGVIREYFARRGIELPPRADQPRPDGQSTGVGRVLKFLESMVHVYDTRHNRLIENIDLLQPHNLIVFFNISEVFSALDQVNVQDLEALRYLGSTLQLRHPSQSRVLLNRKDLQAPPIPPLPHGEP